MGLAVLPPDPEEENVQADLHESGESEADSDTSMTDGDGRPLKRRRLSSSFSRQITLPGEIITDDTQWMR